MTNFNIPYETEREGQIEFFNNYNIPYENDDSVLVDNTDGVYNGNIFEFKLNIGNLNKVLYQAVKYLSKMRIKGESVPATILLIDLNATTVYVYKSKDYFDEIHKVYIGAASKNNDSFVAKSYVAQYNYSDSSQSAEIKKLLTGKKTYPDEMYMPINIDENCIVGWGMRYYCEKPQASKGDFLGDDTGTAVKIIGEIRKPRHFKGLINPYKGKSNEKFKYLMGRLNDRLSKKSLGAFYTPIPYAKKAAELVKIAVERVPNGNDYIILDRCAGTGNLETALIGLTDANGDALIEHCVISTYEYYEYKVLSERIGDKVRDIIPPTEANVIYENGKVSNADAMSKDFIDNPIIKKYIADPKCTIILFENPPYDDTSSIRQVYDSAGHKHITNNKDSFVFAQMSNVKDSFKNKNISTVRDFANRFIWSGYRYYLRQKFDSYILFSPVKYFKSLEIFRYPERRFIKGFLFNRKYFDASPSSIGCILWSYEQGKEQGFHVPVYDIENNNLLYIKTMEIKKVNTTLSSSNTKYTGNTLITDCCDSQGHILFNKKASTILYGDNEVIGYFCPVSASFNIGRLPYFNGRGNYILKSNYLNILPLFTAKVYPFDKWYEKGSIFITYDGGNIYTKDLAFIKSCLIYTCLSTQNKCLSFYGSNEKYYRNELCFDNSRHELPLALKDLNIFSITKGTELDDNERNLIELWYKIIEEARQTKNYNSKYNYGVYQISKELNTFSIEGTGKNKEKIYDYPVLNGHLETLRTMLKKYYKSHITEKMFQYELLK